jgi:hypothetical protein
MERGLSWTGFGMILSHASHWQTRCNIDGSAISVMLDVGLGPCCPESGRDRGAVNGWVVNETSAILG